MAGNPTIGFEPHPFAYPGPRRGVCGRCMTYGKLWSHYGTGFVNHGCDNCHAFKWRPRDA